MSSDHGTQDTPNESSGRSTVRSGTGPRVRLPISGAG
jgi:hypothetical protein